MNIELNGGFFLICFNSLSSNFFPSFRHLKNNFPLPISFPNSKSEFQDLKCFIGKRKNIFETSLFFGIESWNRFSFCFSFLPVFCFAEIFCKYFFFFSQYFFA